MRRAAVVTLALHVGCGVAGDPPRNACPATLEYDLGVQTSAPVLELTLARAPHVEFFPAIGGDAPWGVQRVDLSLRTHEPLELVHSEDGTLEADAVVLGRIDAGDGAVSLEAPLPVGHLLLVRPPDAEAGRRRTPLRVEGRLSVRLGPGSTCQGLDTPRLRRARPRCGNGRLELGEACDDGNGQPGDGCDRCRVEAPRCAPGLEGVEALRPWVCVGEPSRCEDIRCDAESPLPCRSEIRVDVQVAVHGRVAVADPHALEVIGDLSCPGAEAPSGDPHCTSQWPVCTALSLEAVPGEGSTFDRWHGACASTEPKCVLEGSGSDGSIVATATSSENASVDWLVARPVQVQDAHLSAGAEGLVTLVVATTIPSVTAPSAGGFVHRRAAQLMVYGVDGRLRLERRLGGRVEHVQPRGAAALGDGGVLLVAAFPDDFPLFAPDARRRRMRGRTSLARPEVVLRAVRFSAGGDPVWVHDLGHDGDARIALSDAHAWIAVVRPGAASSWDTELFDLDPNGQRRWRESTTGWRALDLGAEENVVRVVELDVSGALRVRALDSEGASIAAVDLQAGGVDATSTVVGLDRGRVVVVGTATREVHATTTAAAFDFEGKKIWTRAWPVLGACEGPQVAIGHADTIAILQPLCELDGRPSGFAVDRLGAEGRHLWRHRLGGPGSGAAGARALALAIDDRGGVVIAGRSDRTADLGGQMLADDGLFVTRLLP
jgi:cysteine-rich repeat protein